MYMFTNTLHSNVTPRQPITNCRPLWSTNSTPVTAVAPKACNWCVLVQITMKTHICGKQGDVGIHRFQEIPHICVDSHLFG